MRYLANPSGASVRAAMAAGHIGAMMTPRQGNRLPPCSIFGIDNGCGPSKDGAGAGYPGDEAYLALLQALGQGEGFDEYDPFTSWCLFAVAPDVVGDAAATIKRSAHMLGWIRYVGFKAAFVGQNGLTNDPDRGWGAYAGDRTWLGLDWDDFDVLFLGGSAECVPCGYVRPTELARTQQRCPACHRRLTEWKLGAVARELTAEALRCCKHVHMGRVNSLKRYRYAELIGCDSADGTYITNGPDINLPKVLGWGPAVRAEAAQATLFGAAA
jgi:hypothetical protein